MENTELIHTKKALNAMQSFVICLFESIYEPKTETLQPSCINWMLPTPNILHLYSVSKNGYFQDRINGDYSE